MDILNELSTSQEISSYLSKFDRSEWPVHIKKLLLYSLRSVQALDSVGFHSHSPSKSPMKESNNSYRDAYKNKIYPDWWPSDSSIDMTELEKPKKRRTESVRAVKARNERENYSGWVGEYSMSKGAKKPELRSQSNTKDKKPCPQIVFDKDSYCSYSSFHPSERTKNILIQEYARYIPDDVPQVLRPIELPLYNIK